MTGEPDRRSRVPILLVLVGVLLAVVAIAGFGTSSPDEPPAASAVRASSASALDQFVYNAQETLRRMPANAQLWAQLGAAYVEQARVTGDPTFYAKSQGALDRSVEIAPDGNGDALIGLGQLANARHDFAAARDYAEQARALRPSTPEVYGVLADAYTQLGDADAATAAVQSMLDVRPSLASFTRASYDLELHGRRDEARAALGRALQAATSADDVAFCRYYLGELAWNAGDVEEAATQYETGLRAAPQNLALQHGTAKVTHARGRLDEAIAAYQAITRRAPLPQYLLEYGELLEAAGRATEARAQYEVLAAAQQLYAAQGSNDDQVAALVAADHGDPADALRLAAAEWGRRHAIFSADALAWALHVNGRDAEALPHAEHAASLGGANASYAFHRGMILAGLGRRSDALAALNDALRINPHFNPLQAPVARATIASLGSGS